MPGVGDAIGSGMRGGGPVRSEHRDLPDGLIRIRGDECGQRLPGCLSGLEQVEPERSVAPLRVGLGRDHADTRRAQSTPAPQANARDCTAAPSWPVSESRATIE